ncbi:MAG: hypothetical protein GF401_08900 [Chitinivibrionales bacterium]|nr:hypothetical protein [Chitinivibrionales bacterium]
MAVMITQIFMRATAYSVPVVCILCVSCDEYPPRPDRNGSLTVVELFIDEFRWSALLKSSHLDEWEAVSVETDSGFFYGKVRMHGGVSRQYPKKSFKLVCFDSVYREWGDKAMVISSQFSDRSFCKYRLASYFFRKTSLHVPDDRPMELYVNGRYVGLFLEREPIDEYFLHKRGLSIASLYKTNYGARFTFRHDMLAQNGWQKNVPDDDMTYIDLERLILTLDKGITEDRLEEIGRILDIRNVLEYYAVSLVIGNWDGITKNFYLYYNPLVGQFQFIPWDLDLTFPGRPGELPEYENDLFEYLAELPSCKPILHDIMADIFDLDEALRTLRRYEEEVKDAYFRDPYLGSSPEKQSRKIEEIEEYLRAMNAVLVEMGIE